MSRLSPLATVFDWVDRKWFRPHADHFERYLADDLRGSCESVLDVACGSDSPFRLLSGEVIYSVGVDAHQPSLDRSENLGIHTETKRIDVLELDEHFDPGSFDAVLLLDLIEHLEKRDALRLLRTAERIARKRVVVFTPNGFLPQEPYDDNEHQRHRSGWSVEEMEQLGYRVWGVNGWKPLRGERARVRWTPRWFWTRVSWLTQSFVRQRPHQAFQLYCVKELEAWESPTSRERAGHA